MKWFRSNIRHGSRLALFALALQFVLAFGHFHGGFANAAASVQSGAGQAEYSRADLPTEVSRAVQDRQPSHRESDHEPGDVCAICAVLALANTVLFATPPLLLPPQAAEFLYLSSEAGFVRSGSARVAFQPRAPPKS